MNKRGTLTIPKDLRRGLEDEALFEAVRRQDGVIELQPRVAIDPSQAWFWTERWQKMEREADEDIAAGRVKRFEDPESFLAWLDSIPPKREDARPKRKTNPTKRTSREV